jgi:uncharacterized protein (TIGR03437 family)
MGPAQVANYTITPEGKLATSAGGTRVLFDGVPAAMLYSLDRQVAAFVPYGVAGKSFVSVQVEYQGKLSPPVSVPVVAAMPALYTQDYTGQGAGSVLNGDSRVNTAQNPAAADEIIQIFGTGEGQSIPGGVDGSITPDLRKSEQPVSVFIGGVKVASQKIEFAGPAPGAVAGLFQVNAHVPVGLTPGPQPIVVQFGGIPSQSGVNIYVK